MKLLGSELIKLIKCGLEDHRDHVTSGVDKALYQFMCGLKPDSQYDLFCCMSELLLSADEEAGPIITDLMKVARMDLEIINHNTFANIGFLLSDLINRHESIDYFRKEAISINDTGLESEPNI